MKTTVENVLANSRDREALNDAIIYLGQRFGMGKNENSQLKIQTIPGLVTVWQLVYKHSNYTEDVSGESSTALAHVRSITNAFLDGRLWERN